MARTKASVGAKVSFGKSSKAQKTTSQPSTRSSDKSKSLSKPSWAGGNPFCKRETPNWQLPITRFFKEEQGETSGIKQKKNKLNVIDSDTESEHEIYSNNDKSNEKVNESDDLNQTVNSEIELLPLIDNDFSHKVDEYFQASDTRILESENKSTKNKGIGKNTKNKDIEKIECDNINKENNTPNLNNNNHLLRKRSLEENFSINSEKPNKKIKL